MSIIIPANSAVGGGFSIDNSARFSSAGSDYLSRTASSTGNRQIFTFSTWVKRGKINTVYNTLFYAGANSNTGGTIAFRFTDANNLNVFIQDIGQFITTNRIFKDPSAWYHIVLAIDTTQATPDNRRKLYINGVQETSFSTSTEVNRNLSLSVNTAGQLQRIGVHANSSGSPGEYFDGYMAETVLIDGQQLAPTSFGEFDEDSGAWKPIDVSGLTFGTNGFHLDMASSTELGTDVSGNSNNLAENNLQPVDQTTDTCTNNFATLNPFAPMSTSVVQTLTEGNLKAVPSSGWNAAYSTIPLSAGKWYVEVYIGGLGGSNEITIGLNPDNFTNTSDTAHSFTTTGVWYNSNGQKWVGNSNSSYGASYDDDDVIGIAINMTDSQVTFYKNNASQGTLSFNSNLTGASSIIFGLDCVETTSITYTNFGNPATGGQDNATDGNSRGSFKYAPPGGYLSICTANLSGVLS